MQDYTGKDGYLNWKVETPGDDALITVTDTTTGKEYKETYTCMYRPIFGYDSYDITMINKILDRLISKAKQNNG